MKIVFRSHRNSKIRYKVSQMYWDTLRKLYEVDCCLSAECNFALTKNSFFYVIPFQFSPLNFQRNVLNNKFLVQSEYQFINRTEVFSSVT
jgi:hypothetical protein